MHSTTNSKFELSHDFNLSFTLGQGPMFRRDNSVRESGLHVFAKNGDSGVGGLLKGVWTN